MNEFLDRIVVTVMPKEHTGKKMGGLNTKISATDASISQNCVCFFNAYKRTLLDITLTIQEQFRSSLCIQIYPLLWSSEVHDIHQKVTISIIAIGEQYLETVSEWSDSEVEWRWKVNIDAITLLFSFRPDVLDYVVALIPIVLESLWCEILTPCPLLSH